MIIGDLDSLQDDTRTYYSSLSPPAQIIRIDDDNHTDFAKAIMWARDADSAAGKGPSDIIVLGGLGGRVDQGISQLHHLFWAQEGNGYDQGRVYLVTEDCVTVMLKPGKHVIQLREEGEADVYGKYVGILPIKEPSVISTKGLRWDVENWETHMGGRVSTSNQLPRETKSVEVETSKEVLFTVSLKGAT